MTNNDFSAPGTPPESVPPNSVQEFDAEAGCDPRLRNLIEVYAELAGARLTELAPDLLELEIPPKEQDFFSGEGKRETPSSIRLAFSLHALEHDPDAEMAVMGSAVFEHVVEAIRARGSRIFHGVLEPNTQHDQSSQELTLSVSRCSVSEPERKVKAHPLGRLLARVVLRSGADVKEQLVSSGVFDLATGTVVPEELAALCSSSDGTSDQASPDSTPPSASLHDIEAVPMMSLDSIIERVIGDIEERMSETIDEYKTLASSSLQEELSRLNKYYDRLIEEDHNPTPERHARVNDERKRRVAEEKRRHELRAVVFPVQLEEWSVLVERARWSLTSESGKQASLASRRYLTGDVHWIVTCPTCGRIPKSLSVCLTEHVVCDSCEKVCTSCEQVFCPDHGIAACHVDGEPACFEHATTCSVCRKQHRSIHQGTCKDGDHLVCARCLRQCESCGKAICVDHATQTADDAPKGSRRLCSECVVYCEGGTNEPVGVDEVKACSSCERFVCKNHQSICEVDGLIHCSRHLRRSDHSRRLVCESHRASCVLEPGSILASDEVFQCTLCGKKVCNRHASRCAAHDSFFCHDHLVPLLDTQGDMGCPEHHSVCHMDDSTYSVSGTSPCPICDKLTCANHLNRCGSCGRAVCRKDKADGQICITCKKLEVTTDVDDNIIEASLGANDGEPMKVKGWRLSRDAKHRVVEADLGWTRKVIFALRHGDSQPDTVVRHSLLGSKEVRKR